MKSMAWLLVILFTVSVAIFLRQHKEPIMIKVEGDKVVNRGDKISARVREVYWKYKYKRR